MSNCCSAKEREKIVEIIERFNREVPNASELKFRVNNGVISTTVPDLVQSFRDHTETSKSFLAVLKTAADAKNMSIVDCAKAIFDSSKAEGDCCSGKPCGCGGGKCSC